MKQSSITFMILLCSTFICAADTDTSTTPPTDPTPIVFRKRPIPKDPSRPKMPAKPIYGEFVNQVLYLFLDETDECSYVMSVSKDDVTVENVTLSSEDLIGGYTISVAAPFSIELTTEGNITYVGEVGVTIQ